MGNKIDIDILNDKINDLQGQINTLTSEMQSKASKDDIISVINVSEEGVRIKGDKINISSETLIEKDAIK
ncbi:hypothetical protein [Siminovitchia sp. 179-K 8D1 HS]|uniref:hypothetical protein n=1 Tax=Siminovitchia sp. 179-K 8D1 HS TaxID=3142385 RepID=UPI00399EEFC6